MPDSSSIKHVPVLIVGGGPVGLTASYLLSRQGIRSLLVERHPGTAVHPKARAINARTMEIYRQHGLEAAIRAAGLPPRRAGMVVWTESLAGAEIERRIPGSAKGDAARITPVLPCLCAQDDFEPVVRRAAERETAATLRFDTELEAFEQDDAGVTTTLVSKVDGQCETVRAQYLIAADGARSQIRQALGVPMIGRDNVYDSVNILLNADLQPWTAERPAALYFVHNPDFRATFLTINGIDRWGFIVNSIGAYGFKPDDFTPERSIAMVRAAVGVPELAVKILGIAPWVAAARVAERFGIGRIFLAGDAAHEMPPTGGFGMNSGIQDVHNLCWKLALVLQDRAAPSLLQTYHDERQPVGQAIVAQSLGNAVSMGRLQRQPDARARPEYLNERGLIFGSLYRSAAIVADGTPAPEVGNPVTDYVPSARPGSRAPHVWLTPDDRSARTSTIDLVGQGFVMMAGARGEAWAGAARDLTQDLPLETVTIGDGAYNTGARAWHDAYGVDDTGAVLVRPDGHVAWRSASMAANPAAALREATDAIRGRA
ncbi:FAD-dependent monooxygenase [Reyranella sp. CPCC 100927]|uniref:FAD-dependent monooxygenase n=1 Tax=Reyranella sp. CPCC 100927 TaxID=2599616 RepID=UPI0011B64516|nr:FAD-dependent monooxygenase [Reyranella sp. CPCC 100927]TWT13847.1 2-polyprenyl-6-methoxyphenol hydroxylase [Reyranella sp. CPCC 100927]